VHGTAEQDLGRRAGSSCLPLPSTCGDSFHWSESWRERRVEGEKEQVVRDNMSSIRSSIHTFTHASINSSVNSSILPQKHRLPIQPLFHPPINTLIYISISIAIHISIRPYINSSKSSSLNHLPFHFIVHLPIQSLIISLTNPLIFLRTHPSILLSSQHSVRSDSRSTFPPSTHLVLNPTEPLIQLPHTVPFTHIQPHIFNNPPTFPPTYLFSRHVYYSKPHPFISYSIFLPATLRTWWCTVG